MRLKKITTSGCDRVADRAYDLSGTKGPADLVVVTGDAGSGKTSLLDLIVVAKEDAGPYAAAAPRDVWRRAGEEAAKITAEVGSSRVDLQACKLEYSIVSPK